jgi:hypothetical protein
MLDGIFAVRVESGCLPEVSKIALMKKAHGYKR